MKCLYRSLPFVSALAATAAQFVPLSPEESRARFVVPDDVQIELVAAEPQVFDPVALAFDEHGLLYVVEDRGYPTDESGAGSVAVLRDADSDGYYETRTAFVDGLSFPNGIMPWRGGVLVTCAPHVYYFQDTDGDDRADVREIFLEGFSLGGSTQLRVSHPTYALDNWLYFTNGLSGGEISVPGHPESGSVAMGANDIRYNPFTHALETTAGQAQFGLAFNDLGDKFVCSNRKHIEHVVLQPGDLARNPYIDITQTVAEIPVHGGAARIFPLSDNQTTAYSHQGTFTAACGLTIYRGDALPAPYRGNGFVCDPTGNLVHRDVLEPDGPTFVARRAEENNEFLATTDNWSRPVFLANGPDGALYLCDMYRKTIEHPTYLPPEVAEKTDFNSGKEHGRIYRITGTHTPHAPRPIDPNAGEELVRLLEHPNAWHRENAQRLLMEAGDASVADALRALTSSDGRTHALYALDGLGALAREDLAAALAHPAAAVREHGLRLLRKHPDILLALHEAVAECATDDDARVRFACALALGDLGVNANAPALAAIAARDLANPWSRAATLSATGEVLPAFASAFLDAAPQNHPDMAEMLRPLARSLALAAPAGVSASWLERVMQSSLDRDAAWTALAGTLDGVASGTQFPGGEAAWSRLVSSASEPLALELDGLHATAIACAAGDTETHTAHTRILAIELLGHDDFAARRGLWARLLSPVMPQEVRAAAVQALGTTRDPNIGAFLVEEERWQSFTPGVRTAALNVLLSREPYIDVLLSAVESGHAPIASIDSLSRSRLLRSRNEHVAERARAVFSIAAGNRAEVYEDYKEALALPADPVAGREAFGTHCGICHEFQGNGKAVGPNLSDIHMQSAESILLHIIDPNREIVAGYEQYNVETTEGELYSGVIASETESSVTLLQAMGVAQTIPRDAIATITTSALSMMPEELEAGLSKQTMCDLIGYLKAE